MKRDINLKLIFDEPSRFDKQNLSGGYSCQTDKITDKIANFKYTLKKIGETEKEINNSLILCKHIQEYCNNFPMTAKLLNWEIINGILYSLNEFIEESDHRYATIDETEEIIDWMIKWVNYFRTDKTFYHQYHEKTGFIHKDIHQRNIIISNNSSYLIDFDMAGIDSLLIDLVRPTSIFIDREYFFPMYIRIKNQNRSQFTQTEIEIIDRVLILDIIFMIGWDAITIFNTEDKSQKLEFIDFLRDWLHCLLVLKNHKNEFNLDFI